MFNKDVIACFSDPDPVTKLIELRDKVVRMLNMLARLMSANLVMYKRLSINALLTIDVHNRDIIFDMIENKITQKDDFEWTRLVSSSCGLSLAHSVCPSPTPLISFPHPHSHPTPPHPHSHSHPSPLPYLSSPIKIIQINNLLLVTFSHRPTHNIYSCTTFIFFFQPF